MMITKREAKEALTKYGIDFGFPNNVRNGAEITCWQDLYSRNGDTQKLRNAIENDLHCPFTTCPSIMLATFGLKRKG